MRLIIALLAGGLACGGAATAAGAGQIAAPTSRQIVVEDPNKGAPQPAAAGVSVDGVSGSDEPLPPGAWMLNPQESHFFMQTAKANAVVEIHKFTGLDGDVFPDGRALVKIDLTSVVSGIDVRDVRMRFLLFETYKYPEATIRAKLDPSILQQSLSRVRTEMPLHLQVDLHGVQSAIDTTVAIVREDDRTVHVTTIKPIVVQADTFGLARNIAKLSEAVNGTPIVTAASFTFDLEFQTGEMIDEIEAIQAGMAKAKQKEETAEMSGESCQIRFGVISTAQSIFFRSGSAQLDPESGPMLDAVAAIADRCPEAKIEVSGHTDSIGNPRANRELSEARARTVADYLTRRGVNRRRIRAGGFGDTRPIASNETEEGRAKNRRIEFLVVGG